MDLYTIVRNKLAATFVRTVTYRNYPTHQDLTIHIPSRDPARSIKVHVYNAQSSRKPTPVLVNFHGSGFVMPMHGSDDEFAQRVKEEAQYTVLDVQYRLAPEHPFPAAPNDAEDVIKWVLERPEEFDLTRFSVSGFSAGGNMALGLGGYVFPKDTFRHVLGLYPPTDMAKDPSTKVAPDASGKPLPLWMQAIFNSCYLPDANVDLTQPLVSPYFIDGTRFPDNVLLITCACDSLAPETEELARKIAAVPKKNVVHRRMEGCDHAWDKSCKPGTIQDDAKNNAYDLAIAMLKV